MNRELQSVATHNKRAADIDMLRAIGIILMLLGHVGFGKIFETYISAFHMPLFFILSGFLFSNKRGFLRAIRHNFVKLFIPYIFWGGGIRNTVDYSRE